jgi:hypothetical protein
MRRRSPGKYEATLTIWPKGDHLYQKWQHSLVAITHAFDVAPAGGVADGMYIAFPLDGETYYTTDLHAHYGLLVETDGSSDNPNLQYATERYCSVRIELNGRVIHDFAAMLGLAGMEAALDVEGRRDSYHGRAWNVLHVGIRCEAQIALSALGTHAMMPLPEFIAARNVTFRVADAAVSPPVAPLPGRAFSSHECIGGDSFTNRTCVFRNVCIRAGRTLYFRDPAHARAPAPLAAPFEFVWLDAFPLMEQPRRLVSYHTWGPHLLPLSEAGQLATSSMTTVAHLLWRPFNDDNVAHILWDNMYGMFASMRVLGVLDVATQLVALDTDHSVITASGHAGKFQQLINALTSYPILRYSEYGVRWGTMKCRVYGCFRDTVETPLRYNINHAG